MRFTKSKFVGLARSLFGLTASAVAGVINTVITGKLILRQPGGVAGTDDLTLEHDGNHARLRTLSGGFIYGNDGSSWANVTSTVNVNDTSANMSANGFWTNNQYLSSVAGQAPDVGLTRTAAGVWKASDGSSGSGWFQNTAGVSRVAGAGVTNDTITPADITGLSATLKAGRFYTGVLALKVSNTTAADGLRIDFDGGAATMTSFDAGVTSAGLPAATFSVSQSEALATDLIATTVADTNARWITVHFAMEVNGAGTFIPRFALEADSGGVITVHDNSYMWIEDTP